MMMMCPLKTICSTPFFNPSIETFKGWAAHLDSSVAAEPQLRAEEEWKMMAEEGHVARVLGGSRTNHLFCSVLDCIHAVRRHPVNSYDFICPSYSKPHPDTNVLIEDLAAVTSPAPMCLTNEAQVASRAEPNRSKRPTTDRAFSGWRCTFGT